MVIIVGGCCGSGLVNVGYGWGWWELVGVGGVL